MDLFIPTYFDIYPLLWFVFVLFSCPFLNFWGFFCFLSLFHFSSYFLECLNPIFIRFSSYLGWYYFFVFGALKFPYNMSEMGVFLKSFLCTLVFLDRSIKRYKDLGNNSFANWFILFFICFWLESLVTWGTWIINLFKKFKTVNLFSKLRALWRRYHTSPCLEIRIMISNKISRLSQYWNKNLILLQLELVKS